MYRDDGYFMKFCKIEKGRDKMYLLHDEIYESYTKNFVILFDISIIVSFNFKRN